jgi:hypothetical protein
MTRSEVNGPANYGEREPVEPVSAKELEISGDVNTKGYRADLDRSMCGVTSS